jgi:hypothetical protein
MGNCSQDEQKQKDGTDRIVDMYRGQASKPRGGGEIWGPLRSWRLQSVSIPYIIRGNLLTPSALGIVKCSISELECVWGRCGVGYGGDLLIK